MEYHLLDLFVAIARRQENAKETFTGVLALAVAVGETWRTFGGRERRKRKKSYRKVNKSLKKSRLGHTNTKKYSTYSKIRKSTQKYSKILKNTQKYSKILKNTQKY